MSCKLRGTAGKSYCNEKHKIYPTSSSTDAGSLKSKCNSQCHCSQRAYEPICGKDGITYFSPCFAGCQFKNKQVSQLIRTGQKIYEDFTLTFPYFFDHSSITYNYTKHWHL